MKLTRFSHNGGQVLIGVVIDDRILPLAAILPDAPGSMREIIANWATIAPEISRLGSTGETLPLEGVTLHAPVPDPGKMLAIGMNYSDHIEEARQQGVAIPEHQVWFTKLPSSLNDPFGDVEKPKSSEKLDYEVELVAIIGRGGRNISRDNAKDAVFGYAVGQDFTARDWQFKTAQWVLGKSFDTHAPIGPWIVTADEIGDPHRLDIKCWVNGEMRQSSNTRLLYFNLWDQIAEVSQAVTLKPGDIIFTGTPGGVGVAMKPPVFLKAGDIVRTEIEDLGSIENRIVNQP